MLALTDAALLEEIKTVGPGRLAAGRYVLNDVLRRNFGALAQLHATLPLIDFAYSVKTNPAPVVLETARSAGLYAEVISAGEMATALRAGFQAVKSVYNGPLPAWTLPVPPYIAFADSVESFAANAERLSGTIAGMRLRPPGVESRFGVSSDECARLADAITRAIRSEIGISFHVRPEDYRGRTWREIVAATFALGKAIASQSGAAITCVDVGGGHTPSQFDCMVSEGDFHWLVETAASSFPRIKKIIAEPGQEAVTPIEFLVAPIVEVRDRSGRREAVADAGYPDCTQISSFPHRIFVHDGNNYCALVAGSDRILGRTCLEYDIIAKDVRLPAVPEAVIVGDVGAYDHSMRFDFARGI